MTATNLTSERITEIREQAQRQAGPFVDPRLISRVQSWWHPGLSDWARAVTGISMTNPLRQRGVPNWALHALETARQDEPCPPTPDVDRVREQRSRRDERQRQINAEHEAKLAEWERVKASLPVAVTVLHNYTSTRHYEFVQGVEHAVLDEDLHVGRLHRRAGRPLCDVPSKAKDLQVFDNSMGGDRLLTCKACWQVARRVAGKTNEAEVAR